MEPRALQIPIRRLVYSALYLAATSVLYALKVLRSQNFRRHAVTLVYVTHANVHTSECMLTYATRIYKHSLKYAEWQAFSNVTLW